MLNEFKLPFVNTREPGGTPTGEEIRKILVSGSVNKLDAFSEFLCFSASRREHIKNVIMPALRSGKIVICDRYLDSSIVYQGLVGGINLDVIKSIHKEFCFNLYPDLTLLLDVNPSIGLKRKKNSPSHEDRFENFNFKFHELIQNKFLEVSKIFQDRIRVINSEDNKEFVFQQIIEQIKHFFLNKKI